MCSYVPETSAYCREGHFSSGQARKEVGVDGCGLTFVFYKLVVESIKSFWQNDMNMKIIKEKSFALAFLILPNATVAFFLL